LTYVKICGCPSPEDALAARDAGADFIGVVFAESRRRVSLETAQEIAQALRPRKHILKTPAHRPVVLERLLATGAPLLVGVFEGQSAAEIDRLARLAGVDVVQLHGAVTGDGLIERWPVIRAVEIGAETSPLSTLEAPAMWLVDSSRGRGRLGDWDAIAALASRVPLMLAGGLTPENVAEAVQQVRPWGVDVSSGVETAGRKDAAKIRAFVTAAKSAADGSS
jgi:phosphoribosylanthranilate isomerase